MTLTPHPDLLNVYTVVSGPETYTVDLREVFAPQCECGDFVWRSRSCKHIAFCLAYQNGDLDA